MTAIEDAILIAQRAVQLDNEGNVTQALEQYGIATQSLRTLSIGAQKQGDASLAATLDNKANEYETRYKELLSRPQISKSVVVGNKSQETQRKIDDNYENKGDVLFTKACNLHRNHDHKGAIDLYAQAGEMYLLASRGPARQQEIKTKLEKVVKLAETLKAGLNNIRFTNTLTEASRTQTHVRQTTPVQRPLQQSASPARSPTRKLSDEEANVVGHTSKVNGRIYLPWLHVDIQEDFQIGNFKDPDGKLELSPQQRKYFHRWARPADLCQNPAMFQNISSKAIVQTIVSDCSFVCSLAIGADYERRFKKSLVSAIVWPKKEGQPCYNPYGKYMIKLHFNGIWRKVLIDDYLPVSQDGRLLCSFTETTGELWVSLIEKAYMKVMGGYNFPGSNSAVDMHALSGWIPERINLKEFQDRQWKRIGRGLATGDVLVTLATGNLDEETEKKTGLSGCHAYAVINMREVEGHRLVHIKNPWNKGRWKGNWSPRHTQMWKPSIRKALNYNPELASQKDDGEFWMDLASVVNFYDVFHLNWNPGLFPHNYSTHYCWSQSAGPAKDRYNMGENPQYSLKLQRKKEGLVWILLSRHITDIKDFADNKEYITCHIFKGGSRVYYPENPVIFGTKINSPHHLTQLNLDGSCSEYTIVVSQHEKASTIRFSLNVYSDTALNFAKVPDIYKGCVERRIESEWTIQSAGGSSNNPISHSKNPTWALKIIGDGKNNELVKTRVQLFAPKEFHAAIMLRAQDATQNTKSSGDYRPGFVVLETALEPGKLYHLIPSTFKAGSVGRFFFKIVCTRKFSIEKCR
eukprot:m.267167 g.267167  ORF g.267167 m.267167 type:complete len:804 (-) comp16243_c1_seq16:1717-4128(-)